MSKPKITFTPPPNTPLWGLIQDVTNPKRRKAKRASVLEEK